MDKNKRPNVEELRQSLGATAEMAMIFLRAALGAGANMEEATRLTQGIRCGSWDWIPMPLDGSAHLPWRSGAGAITSAMEGTMAYPCKRCGRQRWTSSLPLYCRLMPWRWTT